MLATFHKAALRAVIVILFGCCLQAQSPVGRIVGTVRDGSGAAVPSAQITLTDDQRGFTRTGVSDESGAYQFDVLPQGIYTLTFEAQGFKKAIRPAVTLASREVRRADVALEIGDIVQAVTVESSVPAIATDTGEVRAATGTREVFDNLRPTLRPALQTSQYIGYGSFSAVLQGERGPGTTKSQTRYRIDGTEATVLHDPTPPDMIQEVRISTTGLKSESQSPVLVDVVTRSGTNQLHGQVEGVFTNPSLNALGPYPTATRPPGYPTNKMWYFRGAGPVVLPHIYDGKNRTFWWTNWGTNKGQGQGPDSWQYLVAPPAWRTGDFSQAPENIFTNASKTLIDPLSGQPFPDGMIPTDRLSSVAQNIQAGEPKPTIGDLGNPHYAAGPNYQYLSTEPYYFEKYRQATVKFDHLLTSRDTFSYMYGRTWSNWIGSQMRASTWIEKQSPVTRTHIATWTHVFSPTVLNEFRGSIGRAFYQFGPITKDEAPSANLTPAWGSGPEVLQQIGLTITPTSPDFQNAMPAFCVTGVMTSLCDWAAGGRMGAQETIYENRHFANNLSIRRGAHSLKTGIDYLRSLDASNRGNPFGQFSFDGRFSGVPFADFMLGYPGTSVRTGVLPRPYRLSGWLGAYLQDDWQVSSKLTLELGVRIEKIRVPREKNLMMVNFDPVRRAFVVPNEESLARISPAFPTDKFSVLTAAQAGYPELLRDVQQPFIYPRFGFAWRPFSTTKTVLRGGFGMFSSTFSPAAALVTGSPYALNETFQNQLVDGRPALQLPNPYPTPGTTGTVPGQSAFSVDPSIALPWSTNWNITVEHEIVANTGIRLTYMGARAYQLSYQRDINKPPAGTLPYRADCASQASGTCVGPQFPGFSSVTRAESGANQFATVYELEIYHRWSGGLYLTFDYSLNRTLVDGQDSGDYGVIIEDPYNRRRDRGLTSYTAPQQMVFQTVYDLPFGSGKRFLNRRGPLDMVIGGWSVTGLFNWSGRSRLTPIWSGTDFSNTNTFSGRADVVPGCDPSVSSQSPSQLFNANCFTQPAAGRFGNAGRNSATYVNFNPFWSGATIITNKSFYLLPDRMPNLRLRISAIFSNPFNHPFLQGQYLPSFFPSRNIVVNSAGSSAGSMAGNRSITLAARVEF